LGTWLVALEGKEETIKIYEGMIAKAKWHNTSSIFFKRATHGSKRCQSSKVATHVMCHVLKQVTKRFIPKAVMRSERENPAMIQVDI
jgi:hypothetical protein